MIKEMVGFKVVANHFYIMMSCGSIRNKSGVDYRYGKITTPTLEGSLLFFFKNKKDALKFTNKSRYYEIVPCTAYNCRRSFIIAHLVGDIAPFWIRLNKKKSTKPFSHKAPKGTWMAEKIFIHKASNAS